MSNLTPYEILIAEKAEQVPVPDMADNIWASIEEQLDAGGSPDEGDSGTPSHTPPGNGLPGIGQLLTVFTVGAIVITLVWLSTGNKKDPVKKIQETNILPAAETATSVTDSARFNNPGTEKNTLVLPIRDKIDPTMIPDDITDSPVTIDSLKSPVIPGYRMADSIITARDNNPPPVVDSLAITPFVKKPKGVKGITDNDYKISSKKDSTKKKD